MVITAVVLALVLAWSGLADTKADIEIDDAIVDAGVIYGVGRGINAVVSLLQEIEVSVVFATIAPLEFLDPINDISERFSQVMTYALASLALQKILLLVIKNQIFNILLTISATVGIAGIVLNSRFAIPGLKLFLTLVVLRFSLVVVILLNGLVDRVFLESVAAESEGEIQAFEKSMSGVSSSMAAMDEGGETFEELEQRRALQVSVLDTIDRRVQELEASLAEKEQQKARIKSQSPVVDRLNPFTESDPRIKALDQEIEELESLIASKQDERDLGEDELQSINKKIECEKARAAGDSCSFAEWAGKGLSITAIKVKAQSVAAASGDAINALIETMAMVVLKSILLPLLFWWALYRVIRQIWNYSGPETDARNYPAEAH